MERPLDLALVRLGDEVLLHEADAVQVQRGDPLRLIGCHLTPDVRERPLLAKPLAERQLPDSPWRDVAGMLRSFDYVPRVVERSLTDGDQTNADADQLAVRSEEWAAYAGGAPTAQEQVLLNAYVADKAVYETVYETRNRPSWVAIPLQAVARIGAS